VAPFEQVVRKLRGPPCNAGSQGISGVQLRSEVVVGWLGTDSTADVVGRDHMLPRGRGRSHRGHRQQVSARVMTRRTRRPQSQESQRSVAIAVYDSMCIDFKRRRHDSQHRATVPRYGYVHSRRHPSPLSLTPHQPLVPQGRAETAETAKTWNIRD